ncbi:MAG: hypothetical protein ACLRM9_03870 [Collinsella aerofaciens]
MAALSDLSTRAWMSWRACAASLPVPLIPTPQSGVEPSLVPYYNPLFADRFSWALEFRIRCGSVSYVVKDIDGMADAYVRGGTFSYGKKLTFVHSPEAFDETSALLNLVATTVAYLDDITSSRSASYDFARSGFVAERQLPLSEHSIVCAGPAARQTISFSPPGRGDDRIAPTTWRLSCLRKGRTRHPLSAHRCCRQNRAGGWQHDLRLPVDGRFARATLLSGRHRARRTDVAFAQHAAPFHRACCPVARRSISPPTRWASSAAWRCRSCATTPT